MTELEKLKKSLPESQARLVETESWTKLYEAIKTYINGSIGADGKISIDSRLDEIMPWFEARNKEAQLALITAMVQHIEDRIELSKEMDEQKRDHIACDMAIAISQAWGISVLLNDVGWKVLRSVTPIPFMRRMILSVAQVLSGQFAAIGPE